MTAAFGRCWYEDTAAPRPGRPPLTGDVRADVCVVGGGYTGLSAALNLAGRGLSVVLLEAERIGAGASGRNGGQLVSGYNRSVAEIAAQVGRDDAHRLWQMGEAAMASVYDTIARHGIDCDLRRGYLFAAVRRRHLGELAAMQREWQGLGHGGTRLLDRAAMAEMVASPAYPGGLFDPGGGHLHALNYALGLARAAEAAGARLHEDSRALAIEDAASGTRRVRTALGSVTARHVVLAGNAYLAPVASGLEDRIMPVAAVILATEPLGPARAAALIPSDAAVSDVNFVLDYFRRTPDHRLLFGGGLSYRGRVTPGLGDALRRRMLAVFPQLADAAISHLWGGHVAITMSRLPQLARPAPGLYVAHGYSGHGIALAGLAGTLIAEAVAGTEERFDVFARLPHRPFPGGGRLRTALLLLATSWMRLRDLV